MPAKKTTKKAAAKKAPAKKITKAPSAKKAPAKKTITKKPAPTAEAISKAAYLNYRRRVELGLPGDHDSDWLEAVKSLS